MTNTNISPYTTSNTRPRPNANLRPYTTYLARPRHSTSQTPTLHVISTPVLDPVSTTSSTQHPLHDLDPVPIPDRPRPIIDVVDSALTSGPTLHLHVLDPAGSSTHIAV